MSYTSWSPPFSYSGGKTKLTPRLLNVFREVFPAERRLLSPFLGAGAFELRWMHAGGGYCHGADVEKPLINFWCHLLENPLTLARVAWKSLPIDEPTWRDWHAEMEAGAFHTVQDAARFYLMRYTKVVHGWDLWRGQLDKWNKPRVHRPYLKRLSLFRCPRLSVESGDFRRFLDKHDGVVYADPPYYSDGGEMERVYANQQETNVFSREDHAELADALTARKGWVLSNSDSRWVRSRYQDYRMVPVQVRYSSRQMHGTKEDMAGELIIISPP